MAQGTIQNAVATKTQTAAATKKPETIKDWIDQMAPEIKRALPSVITPERFTRIAVSAVSNNPMLAECTPKSFVAALMNAAQLGLEPNTPLGQAYLIPFKNNAKGVVECQFIVGYKGLIDLAYRSGDVKSIQSHVVYENDEFEYSYGLDSKLHHVPADGDRGNPVKVYAVFELVNGGYGFEVSSIADIRRHAQKYSKSFNNGPWQTAFEEMAKKTALRAVLKYAPIKSDFVVRAIASDETIKTEISDDMATIPGEYDVVDDIPDVTPIEQAAGV